MMSLFHGLQRAHGTYRVERHDSDTGKNTGKARTLKEPITMKKWRQHLRGEIGLGIVPIDDDDTCRFGAIDVDVYDLNIEALSRRVDKMNLPFVTCRTKSGGAHLYVFFSEPVPAKIVKDRLLELAIVLGFPTSEVFPKQYEIRTKDDIGNWINMPYFGGDKTTRYAVVDGESMTVEEFLDHAEASRVDRETFENVDVKRDERMIDGPPCLEHLSSSGFPQGTRNKALFNLGVYCRMKYGDDWQTRLEEFNREFLHPPLSTQEVGIIVGSLKKKSYFYTCKEDPIASACNKSVCVKRPHGIGGSANDPGVVIECLVKIETDPPTWVVTVEGKQIRLDATDDLLNQRVFRRRCVESLNILPNTIKGPAWDELVNGLLERVEVIDAPGDAGMIGQFELLVENFCTENAMGKNEEDLLLGKPYIDEKTDLVFFRSIDMLSYMHKKRFMINAKDAWSILRDRGAIEKRFRVKGRHIRAWGVPIGNHQTESFDIPEIPVDEDF